MEKTYVIATLIFGWFITISLAVFSYFAFSLGYPIIGSILILITLFGSAMNIFLKRKWTFD